MKNKWGIGNFSDKQVLETAKELNDKLGLEPGIDPKSKDFSRLLMEGAEQIAASDDLTVETLQVAQVVLKNSTAMPELPPGQLAKLTGTAVQKTKAQEQKKVEKKNEKVKEQVKKHTESTKKAAPEKKIPAKTEPKQEAKKEATKAPAKAKTETKKAEPKQEAKKAEKPVEAPAEVKQEPEKKAPEQPKHRGPVGGMSGRYTRMHAFIETCREKPTTADQLMIRADQVYVEKTGMASNLRESYSVMYRSLAMMELLGLVTRQGKTLLWHGI